MKIKVRLARWLSLRSEEQTRKERRALRDYSRQELGRIRQAGNTVQGAYASTPENFMAGPKGSKNGTSTAKCDADKL